MTDVLIHHPQSTDTHTCSPESCRGSSNLSFGSAAFHLCGTKLCDSWETFNVEMPISLPVGAISMTGSVGTVALISKDRCIKTWYEI